MQNRKLAALLLAVAVASPAALFAEEAKKDAPDECRHPRVCPLGHQLEAKRMEKMTRNSRPLPLTACTLTSATARHIRRLGLRWM
jgi:hypothetical protein